MLRKQSLEQIWSFVSGLRRHRVDRLLSKKAENTGNIHTLFFFFVKSSKKQNEAL